MSGAGFVKLRVTNAESVNHDCVLITLKVPTGTPWTPPAVGKHVRCTAAVNGVPAVRSYTPVWLPSEREPAEDEIVLLVKVYERGLLTPALGRLAVGDHLECS